MKALAFLLIILAVVFGQDGQKTNRIIGGTSTNTGAYPYQVALVQDQGNGYAIFCGGSIIAKNYILTAAHCFRDVNSGNVDRSLNGIYAASTTSISGISTNKRYKVQQAFIHPDYISSNPASNQVDICVLQVTDITFDSNTQPIVLARPQDANLFSAGTTSYVSGFGLTNGDPNQPNRRPSDTMQVVAIPIVSQSTCNIALARSGFGVNFPTICAGADGKDSCQGDSGGPLTVITGSTFLQVGVVIFGTSNGCGVTNNYGVYTDVSAYRSWVESKTGALPSLGDSGVAQSGGNSVGPSNAGVTNSVSVYVILASLILFFLSFVF